MFYFKDLNWEVEKRSYNIVRQIKAPNGKLRILPHCFFAWNKLSCLFHSVIWKFFHVLSINSRWFQTHGNVKDTSRNYSSNRSSNNSRSSIRHSSSRRRRTRRVGGGGGRWREEEKEEEEEEEKERRRKRRMNSRGKILIPCPRENCWWLLLDTDIMLRTVYQNDLTEY